MMWRSRSSGLHDESFLAALGRRLHSIAESVQPREEFRSSLRTFLMMEASTALVPDPSRPAVDVARPVRVAPRRRIVIATAFIATTLGLGGLSTASASALPGEALYP